MRDRASCRVIGCGLAVGIARRGVGAMLEQQADAFDIAAGGGRHQRGYAPLLRRVGIGSAGQQKRDNVAGACCCCAVQWPHPHRVP
jgi:hypothetical protein